MSFNPINSGELINAANVINCFRNTGISSNPSGDGSTQSYSIDVRMAESIAWGPASGALGAQYPTSDAGWISQFGGNGRSGGNTGNAWATANLYTTDLDKTYPGNPSDDHIIFASNYSGDGSPSSTAVLYEAARNFLTINWCRATYYITGGNTTVYGPFKASFDTLQSPNDFIDPVGPRGLDGDNVGSVAYATADISLTQPNPPDGNSWGINNYINSLVKSFNSRPITEVSLTVCHVSCHSSCHGSRGRR